MSVALIIKRHLPGGERQNRVVSVSTEKIYWNNWNPVIEAEGYVWLEYLAGGLVIDADNLDEVLAELRHFRGAVPRYYEQGTPEYNQLDERLDSLIDELEHVNRDELRTGELELSVG